MVQSVQNAGVDVPPSNVTASNVSPLPHFPSPLPQLLWRESVVITPLTRSLCDFFSATRLVTWDHHIVDDSFNHQDAGSRLLFALWIPEHEWLKSLTGYESKHGKGQGKVYAVDDEEWIDCNLRSLCPSMVVPTTHHQDKGITYRPAATVAVDFDNLSYDLLKDFSGNVANMKAWCACRETQVAYICLLTVLPPFQGQGYARDLMDFAEEWVLRRGWTCEDATFLDQDRNPSGVQQWIGKESLDESHGCCPPRRLPPCRAIALATEATNSKNNKFYQRRGYKETQIVEQDGWTARFYLKHLC